MALVSLAIPLCAAMQSAYASCRSYHPSPMDVNAKASLWKICAHAYQKKCLFSWLENWPDSPSFPI